MKIRIVFLIILSSFLAVPQGYSNTLSCKKLYIQGSTTRNLQKQLSKHEIAYIIHTTKLSNLKSILSGNKILTRDDLSRNHGRLIHGMGGRSDVVYMQLVPNLSIGSKTLAGTDINFFFTGKIGEPSAEMTNVILIFSNKKANEAIQLNSSWLFGQYVEGVSARPNESQKIDQILASIKIGSANELLLPSTSLDGLVGIFVHPSRVQMVTELLMDIAVPLGANWEKLIISNDVFPSL